MELRGSSLIETHGQGLFKDFFSGDVFVNDFSFDDSLEEPEEFGLGHKTINKGSVVNDAQEGKIFLAVLKACSEQVPGILNIKLSFINELK